MKETTRKFRWLAVLAVALAFAGCDDDGEDMDGGTDAAMADAGDELDAGRDAGTDGGSDAGTTAQGEIRVWHLAAGAGMVDVFIDGEETLSDFEFEANTDFIPLDAGNHDIAVAPAGMGIGAAVITVDDFALGEDEQWTIIASQLDADTSAAGAFAALPILEDTSAPASGNIAFRIFHAAYDVDSDVDVHNLNDVTLPEIADGLAQGTVTSARLEVPNAAYGLGLDIDDDGAVDVVTESPIDMPTAGATITIGAISKPGEEAGETETELVFLVNAGANIHDETELEAAEVGFLRFWHLAAEAGTVDIFVDGTAVATAVEFEGNSAYAPFLAGTYDIAIAPTGMTAADAVITADDFALGDGESYTVLATQNDADASATGAFGALPILEDRTAPAAGSIRFRVFHASYVVDQAVAIHNIDGSGNPEIVAAIAQGAVAPGPGFEVANGAYTLGIDVGDDGTINFQTSADGTTAGPIDMPVDGALITIGAISKPDGTEEETELVFLINDGATIHDEIGLIAF
ncbi:MAG: DUF4397 domain-containing protein [Sandaracinaceae bacterium]